MNSMWGWPIIESLHFIGLCLLLGTVGVFDLRMLGLAKQIPYRYLHKLVPFGVAGYLINVATGIMFLTSAPDQYVYNPAFQTKMLFMLLAGINMLSFYGFCNQHVQNAGIAPLPKRIKLVAGISLIAWSAIIVCGRLITYFRPPYHWCLWCYWKKTASSLFWQANFCFCRTQGTSKGGLYDTAGQPNCTCYVDGNAFSKIDQILDSVLTILLKQSWIVVTTPLIWARFLFVGLHS